MKCGSLKSRDERKQTLDTRIYPVVRIATKAPPTSTLLKHSRRVSLPGNQVSSVNTITVTLIPIFTKGDCPRRRGYPSPAQSCRRRSTPSRRVVDVPASHQCSKGPAHRDTSVWFTQEPVHKDLNLAHTLSQELT